MSADDLKPAAETQGDPVEFAVLTEIAIIAHLADTAFARLLPKGFTTAQFGVLNHLIRKDTQETIGELASAMQVSQPTMSSTVRKLEDSGFIELVYDPDDRRVRRVSVTKSGRAIRAESIKSLNAMKTSALKDIDPADWALVLPALGRIRKTLDAAR